MVDAHVVWKGSMTPMESSWSIYIFWSSLTLFTAPYGDGGSVRYCLFAAFVLHRFIRTQLASSHAVKKPDHEIKFFAKREIYVWYHLLFLPAIFQNLVWYIECDVLVNLFVSGLWRPMVSGANHKFVSLFCSALWSAVVTPTYTVHRGAHVRSRWGRLTLVQKSETSIYHLA